MSTENRKFIAKNIDELEAVVDFVKSILSGRDVLLLNGPMGVGKTEFVRALVASMQGESISSPSFAIHNNYSTGAKSIDHLDLFRIEGEDDLESTGFWDLFSQQSGLIILEWAEKLDQKLLPRNWHKISIDLSFLKDSSRQLVVQRF